MEMDKGELGIINMCLELMEFIIIENLSLLRIYHWEIGYHQFLKYGKKSLEILTLRWKELSHK